MVVTGGLTWWKDFICVACFSVPDQRDEVSVLNYCDDCVICLVSCSLLLAVYIVVCITFWHWVNWLIFLFYWYCFSTLMHKILWLFLSTLTIVADDFLCKIMHLVECLLVYYRVVFDCLFGNSWFILIADVVQLANAKGKDSFVLDVICEAGGDSCFLSFSWKVA